MLYGSMERRDYYHIKRYCHAVFTSGDEMQRIGKDMRRVCEKRKRIALLRKTTRYYFFGSLK